MDGDEEHEDREASSPAGLMPFTGQGGEPGGPVLPMMFLDYVELLEWTGRAARPGGASMEGSPPSAIRRLGIQPGAWLATMSRHGLSHAGALGTCEELAALAERHEQRWVKGVGLAKRLFRSAA